MNDISIGYNQLIIMKINKYNKRVIITCTTHAKQNGNKHHHPVYLFDKISGRNKTNKHAVKNSHGHWADL